MEIRRKLSIKGGGIRMHSLMTKVISLSEGAYGTRKKMKRPGESFSDVVLRMAGGPGKKPILEFSHVMEDRERTTSRMVGI